MNGIHFADVIAVFSSPKNLGILALGLCLIGYYGWRIWTLLPKRRSRTPREFQAITVLVRPYVVTLTGSGRKGFEHRSTVVDLAERRRNGRVH